MSANKFILSAALIFGMSQVVAQNLPVQYPVDDTITVYNASHYSLALDTNPRDFPSYGGKITATPWNKYQMQISTQLLGTDDDQFFAFQDNAGHRCVIDADADEMSAKHTILIMRTTQMNCEVFKLSPIGVFQQQSWLLVIKP
jgi:hypothetical protein